MQKYFWNIFYAIWIYLFLCKYGHPNLICYLFDKIVVSMFTSPHIIKIQYGPEGIYAIEY